MSDQQSQPTSGETGTLGAAPAVPAMPASSEPVKAAADAEVEAARLAPDQEETSLTPEAPKVDAVSMEAPKVEAPKADSSKMDAPKIDAPKIDAVKPEAPRFPGNVTIMSPGDRVGADAKAAAAGSAGKRRFGAMAAVVALATVAGALGGALATAGIGKLMAGDSAQASVKDSALETSVARLDAEIVALKAGLEHNSKATTGQLNKASDRLDKVEKAQAEPAAKLAKLSETVDKLRAAQTTTTAAAAPAAAKDITGSIPQQVAAVTPPASAPAAPPKPEMARLPTVEGWILRDVANGSALIESRRGMYEVYAGDPIPGLGRVDAIRRQDGRWVVVTSKGLIVAR
ncbi:hypothetical protein [Bradyrhizobium sp. McL0615]|uniref:hypothetical protein n=1 Tax=Bradyrhizobium sp. McL0615 TaxID=3415673 RepID=UPI003CEBD234